MPELEQLIMKRAVISKRQKNFKILHAVNNKTAARAKPN